MRAASAEPSRSPARVAVRSCISCRTRRPQPELMRLRAAAGEIVIETTGTRGPGRGAYLCAKMECWKAVLRPGTLQRSLRQEIGGFDHSAITAALAGMICDSPPGISPAIPSGGRSEEEL